MSAFFEVLHCLSKVIFKYSFDNKLFTSLGGESKMTFSLNIFTDNKFCIFNYVTREIGGYVDFGWFRMQ